MGENDTAPLPDRLWAALVRARAVVGAGYLTGLVFVAVQARGDALAAHFGLPAGHADPRSAYLPVALWVLIGGLSVWMLVMVVATGRAMLVPGAAAIWLVGALLIPPYSPRVVLGRLGFFLAIWVGAAVVRLAARRLRRFADRLRDWLLERISLAFLDRVDEGLAPAMFGRWGRLVAVTLASAALLVAAHYGGREQGRLQARSLDTFDVVGRGHGTVTVVFVGGTTLYERVLDVSPDASGRPRNRWLPTIVVRPLPVHGVTATRTRLGPTKRLVAQVP